MFRPAQASRRDSCTFRERSGRGWALYCLTQSFGAGAMCPLGPAGVLLGLFSHLTEASEDEQPFQKWRRTEAVSGRAGATSGGGWRCGARIPRCWWLG